MSDHDLPDLPSDLLELALDDLEAVRRDPAYRIDMNQWHRPSPLGCAVCLSGAVMACRLGATPKDHFMPSYFPIDVELKLRALDALRVGDVWVALVRLNRPLEGFKSWVHQVPSYRDDPVGFVSALRKLAGELRSRGL